MKYLDDNERMYEIFRNIVCNNYSFNTNIKLYKITINLNNTLLIYAYIKYYYNYIK